MEQTMTKMEKIVLLLAFYTSPWGAAKAATWEFFGDDKLAFSEDMILSIIGRIINGIDEKSCDWTALDYFKEATIATVGDKGDNND